MSGAENAADRRVKEQAVRLLQRMQAKLDAAEARLSAPIAVIGMGCRFPIGDTPDAVWTALAAGRDGIRPVPPERWEAGEGPVARGGFLDGVDLFDAAFFGISPREAVQMDPQQRLMLEVAWEALEDAGLPPDRLEGTKAGVYLGCCTADYARVGDPDDAAADGYAATGNAPGVAAGRIAYTLGLQGPALVVDTACSSSLVALHLAVQALRAGECAVALTGGVNLTLLPQGAATLDRLSMLSPDGACRAFDADANGFVRGEGAGVLVLRPLADAQAAGDRVLAVIRGTAVNQDGRSAGLTAPNGPAQEAVIRAALANAGLSPEAVDVVEAHGTGTALGDPIEMHALASVFGGRARELLVGSVKTNIGHAEAAAGVAGLVKAVLMLRHQAVPPTLHFERLNPHIDLGGVPISVPTALAERDVQVVGVSSFGFSGTNAHVVLERAEGASAAGRGVMAGAASPGVTADTAPEGVMAGEGRPSTTYDAAGGTVVDGRPAPAMTQGAVPAADGTPVPVAPTNSAQISSPTVPATPPALIPSRLLISARTPDALRRLVARYEALLAAGASFPDLCHSAAVGRARLPWWVCVDTPEDLAAATPSDAPHPEIRPSAGRRVDLPLTPFNRERYWRDDTDRMPGRRLDHAGETPVFEVTLQPNAPLLADHQVRGERLLPAADMLERLRAAAEATGQGTALRDVTFDRPLAVTHPRRVQVLAGTPIGLFARAGEGWQRHAAAHPTPADAPPLDRVDLAALAAGCPDQIDPAAFAAWIAGTGLAYGPFYDCITALARGPGQALARLAPAPAVALLDAAFRTAGAIAFGQAGAARLPAGIARYERLATPAGAMLWAHARLVEEAPDLSVVDIRLLDESGAVLLRIDGLRLAAAGASVVPWRSWLHRIDWVPAPSPLDQCAEIVAALDDPAPLEAALDAAAARYARDALATVREDEVIPRHRRLWQHLPRLASRATDGAPAECALLEPSSPHTAASDPALPARPASASPDPALLARPEYALLARCGAALPDVLRGTVDPLALIFGDGAAGEIYRDAPAYRAANQVVATLAAGALPPTGPVRVLEIGAGTGGTTESVLAALDPARTEYWFTDLSPTLVAQARTRFAAQHFQPLDIERSPAAQGIPAGAFDLVLAANVLHATADLGTTVDHALQALAPQGRLLLLETAPSGEPPGGWVDLVFGLTDGWWRFADTALRPDYPLLARPAWAALLHERGLEVETLALPGHTVVLARRRVGVRLHRDAGGTAAERCAAFLDTIRSLRPEEGKLVLLTSGAMGPAVTDPAGAALWGMLRSLRLERPGLVVRGLDAPDPEAAWASERFTAEPEVAVADGVRCVPRLSVPEAGPPVAIPADRFVLITGAYGGLGRLAADWLVRRGARHLVLTGRTAPETPWTAELRAAGVTVRLEPCDLADPAARAAWIGRLPPLAGIVHAAGTLDDATLAEARAEQFATVLGPKFDAALALDAAFPDLDFFLLFSSAVGLFGQAGQASHVAASVALDALAIARQRRGQAAVSLGWGPWREIGAAADRTTLLRRMEAQGFGTISPRGGEAVLDWARGARGAVAVLPVDRARFLAGFAETRPPAPAAAWQAAVARAMPGEPVQGATTGRRAAANVLGEAAHPSAGPTGGAGTAPAGTGPAPAAGLPSDLPDAVAQEAAAVLGYRPGQALDRAANLFELGLDSLMAVELRNRLQRRFPDRTLSATLLFEHSSVAALAAHLAGETRALPVPVLAVAADAPIAVVGLGCRFPADGADPARFWAALAAGRDGVGPHPDRPDGRAGTRLAGYLPDVAGFDPTFFGIAPREAVFMDPQHRLVLEVAWEALEDALIPADRLSGTAAGVFLGMCNYDYAQIAAAAEGADGYAGTGGAPSIAAGRISYLLGLTGPALVVDTACSSSLVAVHLAVQALRRGECALALAGGVNLTLGPGTTTALERLSMLSPDGHCKAFDARADGFVRGEGCGMVVLKRFSDAEASGDRVLAVIRGSAVNQDGRSAGLTAPNGPAQEAVIRAALADAGLGADAVDVIEAHGTGTALGDPIEMHTLASVFGGRTRELLVGSVKTNIGHAEAAAGIAGLVKAVLMLRHQAVPPTLHFERLNPHIDLGGVPIAVPTALAERDVQVVGVSSFGFSGTNAHVVLERAEGREDAAAVAPAGADPARSTSAGAAGWAAVVEPSLPASSPSSTRGSPPSGAAGDGRVKPGQDAEGANGRVEPGHGWRGAAGDRRPAPAMTREGTPAPVGSVLGTDLAAEPLPSCRLLISARTPDALRLLIARYQARLAAGVAFADLCHSAAVGRARLPWWVCVETPEDLATAIPSNGPPPEIGIPIGRRVDLPLSPFQRQPYWAHPSRTRPTPSGTHPLLGTRLRSALALRQFEAVLAPDQPVWLTDHAVAGRVIVPAAALVEAMLAAAAPTQPLALTDITFRAMLVPAEQPVVQTTLDPASGQIEIAAAPEDPDAAFTPIASGRLAPAPSGAPTPSDASVPASLHDLAALEAAATRPLDLPALYERFAAAGLAYGPAFQALRSLRGGDGVAVADLAPPEPAFRLDPRLLDAAWQSLAAALPPDSTAALVPVGLDRLTWFGGVPARSVLRLTAPDRADCLLLDAAGRVVVACEGLRLATIGLPAAVLQDTVWEPAPTGTETPSWIDCRAETDPVAACWRVLTAVRTAQAEALRLAVLASGATADPPRVAQAALVGLLATLARERPDLRPVLLDLAAGVPPPIPADSGPLLAWRDGTLLAPRLVPRAPVQQPAAPFVLARGTAATLDALRWAPTDRRTPGPGEVEIEVAATGINFRDVMNLLGVYPGDGGAPGVECAGTITAVGPGVTDRRPGEPVVAIAPGSFASHVIADVRLVCPVPLELDWQVAAAQPVAMLTARLALTEVARLRPGQRVLIHAATGGVGLAALALARRIGATVVATAGSPAKRAHLAALGVTEIYDSRSLDFAAAAPVDAVLNSLTGPAIPAGLRLLAPGGVFLELGKAELWTEAQVRAIRTNVRYEVVALDRVILEEPARVGAMLRDAMVALAAGEPALPVQPHPFGAAVEALRDLQAARHIGKRVLARARFRPDASYVVTGGTGALGRHVARFLRARGAGHVVLLARRPAEVPDATVLPVDVADAGAVQAALAGVSPPIKGVFHLAAALHDATAARLTEDDLAAAFAAKLRGAEALDRATAALPLDHFVLFGSLAGVVGSAGQANYAAANAALDALVRRRRAEGRPALLLDWGAWQGEGMAQALSGPALSPDAALAALDVALCAGLSRAAISAAAAPVRPATPDLAEQLAAAVGTGKRAVLAEAVDAIVGRILGLGALALERERPLTELGLDSLMAVELRNALGAAIGRTLPTSLVFDHPTAAALADALAAALGLVAARSAIPDPAPPPTAQLAAVTGHAPDDGSGSAPDAEHDDAALDDDAALALLERKLSHAGY